MSDLDMTDLVKLVSECPNCPTCARVAKDWLELVKNIPPAKP